MENTRSKIGTFFVDTDMTLLTIRSTPEEYKLLLRKSIYIAIWWMQHYILLSDTFNTKKLQFISDFKFDSETNTQLIRYCNTIMNNSKDLINIVTHSIYNWKYSDICKEDLYVTEVFPSKYLISVPVKHMHVHAHDQTDLATDQDNNIHIDIVPITDIVF